MKNKRGMVLAMVWLIAGSGASVIRIYSNQQATEELGLYFLRFIITTVSDVEGGNDRWRIIRIWSSNKHRREVLFWNTQFYWMPKIFKESNYGQNLPILLCNYALYLFLMEQDPLRLLLRPNVALVIIFGILQGTHREFHSPYEGCGTRSWLVLSKNFTSFSRAIFLQSVLLSLSTKQRSDK